MAKMRATVFRGVGNYRVEEVDRPHAGFGEAVLRITLTTICGTHLHTALSAGRGSALRAARVPAPHDRSGRRSRRGQDGAGAPEPGAKRHRGARAHRRGDGDLPRAQAAPTDIDRGRGRRPRALRSHRSDLRSLLLHQAFGNGPGPRHRISDRDAPLLGARRVAARERALRPREGLLHRRRQAPHRPVRAGERRQSLPRRGGRHPPPRR
jgi:hypothetical protein